MTGQETHKPLSEMSNEELWQIFPIILSEYQECWKTDYSAESNAIKSCLAPECLLRIRHMGSTSVPGLLAKPTIDILLEISDDATTAQLIQDMEAMGYIYSPQPDNPAPHMMFMKGYTPRGFEPPVYHVHVRYLGDWDEIYFRDYLIKHPEAAQKYAALKLQLKREFEHDRDAYTEAKSAFIQRITALSKQKITNDVTKINSDLAPDHSHCPT